MRPLSGSQIIRIWEIGQHQHPLDRALTMLRFACPEKSAAEIASLCIGQRDAYLLTLREMTFGATVTSFAECPQCQERLETNMNVADLRIVDLQEPKVQEYSLAVEGYNLRFRLPNSWDLATIANYRDFQAAKMQLGQRCLLDAHYDGIAVAYQQLPPAIIARMGEQMVEYDPQAEIILNFDCPACGHHWQLLFDIVSFFWTELCAQAKRLLREVHVLARFYGWREADILAMSTVRRHLYLGLVST